MRFKIDWASLYWEGNLPFLLFFYFVFEGKFQVQAPRGAYIRRGDLKEGFLRYDIGGLIFGGAYFRNFTACHTTEAHLTERGSHFCGKKYS